MPLQWRTQFSCSSCPPMQAMLRGTPSTVDLFTSRHTEALVCQSIANVVSADRWHCNGAMLKLPPLRGMRGTPSTEHDLCLDVEPIRTRRGAGLDQSECSRHCLHGHLTTQQGRQVQLSRMSFQLLDAIAVSYAIRFLKLPPMHGTPSTFHIRFL